MLSASLEDYCQCWMQSSSTDWRDSSNKSRVWGIIRHWPRQPGPVGLGLKILKHQNKLIQETYKNVSLTSSQRLYVDKWGGGISVNEVSDDHEQAQEEGVSRSPARELEVGEGGEPVILCRHHVKRNSASEGQSGLSDGENTFKKGN